MRQTDTKHPMPEGSAKENQVLDAVKAANITLTEEEVSSLEKVADSLELNVIRFWEKEGIRENKKLSVNVVDESWLAKADKMGTISGNKEDKSEAFAWTMGENGAPIIDEAKVSIECEVDGNYELENFDHFICKILATYADEAVLNEQGKIDYHTFKPVLFEFPTYEYFVTGEKVGNCGKMN